MDEEKTTDEEIDEIRRNEPEPKKESKWMWAVLIIFIAILIYGVILFAMPWVNSFLSGS
jgi:flagellar basal body-associated protein FliL